MVRKAGLIQHSKLGMWVRFRLRKGNAQDILGCMFATEHTEVKPDHDGRDAHRRAWEGRGGARSGTKG
jgi:hypothetical protein